MEHSKIPFPSRLKPPTQVSSIATASGSKFASKVLQPRELNKCVDDSAMRHPAPARRLLSRRSKSFSDLRAAVAKPTFDPLAKRRALGTISTATKPLTKSTSASNLHSDVRKPFSRAGLKTIAEKPALNRPATSTAKSVKRPATSANEEVKPKVAKAAKPAPYDYKARFNLLTERHTTLVQTHKEMKQKVIDAENNLEQYNTLKEDHAKLQEMYESTRDKNVTLEHEKKHLLKEYEDYTELKKKFAALQAENSHNVLYIKQLEESNSTLTTELKNLKTEHRNLTENHQELAEQHNVVKCNNELLAQQKTELKTELTNAYNEIDSLKSKVQLYKTTVQDHEELRRAMHNQIQDLKGTIRVFCRVRPSKVDEDCKMLCNITYVDEETLEIKKGKESISCISGKPTDLKLDFTFDKVFPPEATQAEIFEELSQLVQSALDGYHVCVFAYGQTGSGKTYTMQGENSFHHSGMIPRTITLIFKLISNLKALGWSYAIETSFLEIYNETIRDLLDPNNRGQHEIRFNEGKGTTVTNLTIKSVESASELQQLMITANRNRAVAVTNYNEHSSRSHAVTKIALTGTNEEMKTAYMGSLSLVDLAGSESAKTSNAERIVETKNINKSLSTLGSVMAALHNKESHIPYRNSKLTYLLQSSLGGNSKTLMFVNVAPFEECYGESVNALRFAAKVKEVKIGSRRNKTYLRRELSNLSKP